MSLLKLFKDSVDIAGTVIVDGGKLVAQGVSTVYDTVVEDSEKLDEIKRIDAMCREMVAQFNELKKEFEHDLECEQMEYLELVKKLSDQFEKFQMLMIFLDDINKDNENRQVITNNESQRLFSDLGHQPFETRGVVAYGAGVAVGVGSVGILTASGFGVFGGLLTFATAFLAPAIAVTGYLTDKQIQKAYEEAKEKEKKCAIFQKEGQALLKKCNKSVAVCRYINREMYAFITFFDELLNMSLMAAAVQKTEKYRSLLKYAAEILISYKNLSLVDSDGMYNDNIIREIATTKARSEKCKSTFYEYMASLSPNHQEILNELKNQRLINDKLQTEIQWHKDNQPQNYIVRNRTIRNEFNKALREATKELDIISSWMTFYVVNIDMQNAFEQLLKQGVIIKILYGIGDMSPNTSDERNRRTLDVAEHLQRIFRDYTNFRMKCANTHEKLFICDEKFYVSSSLNILSFRADYTGNDVREESGEASNNVKLMREYRKSLFDF